MCVWILKNDPFDHNFVKSFLSFEISSHRDKSGTLTGAFARDFSAFLVKYTGHYTWHTST